MSNYLQPTILLIGFDSLLSESSKNRVLEESYNFINPLELKLNNTLKDHVIGVLVFTGKTDFELIYDLPNLRVVCCMTSGVDYLDLDVLYSKNVVVKNCSNEASDSTSEIGMLLILNSARRTLKAIQALHNPTIYYNSINEYVGINVNKKVLGIIGLGAIGQSLANKASLGFGMKIIYHQRNKKSSCLFPYYENLNEMLPLVDFLVISCPLTNQTKHLINMNRLKLMKSSAYLINVTRGSIVKTNDLVDALRCGIISGAGLDVVDPEPLPSAHPLLHMNNVMVLPHIGTFALETRDIMLNQTLRNLKDSLQTN